MKPIMSQRVLVLVDPEQNGGEDAAPAVITAVYPDDRINVYVYPDRAGPEYCLTGLRLHETRAEALAAPPGDSPPAWPVIETWALPSGPEISLASRAAD